MSRRKIGLFVLLCCTVLYAADSTTTVELPDTIAAGDYCEAVAQLPQNARAISGAQVLGCDWTWYNHSGNFISWESTYPMNVAERHGVRFEGQFVYVGEGSGPERIYDWELNVIDPNKTCDWSGYKIIPVDHSPFSPDFTGTTITTLSCPVVKRTFFSDLHETVCLAHDEQGNALIGRFIFTLLSFTAMPSTLPSPESEKEVHALIAVAMYTAMRYVLKH